MTPAEKTQIERTSHGDGVIFDRRLFDAALEAIAAITILLFCEGIMSETKERQASYFLAVDGDGHQYCILVIEELAGYRTDEGTAEWVPVRQILREINGGTVSRIEKGQYIIVDVMQRRAIDALETNYPSFPRYSPECVKVTSDDPRAV